MLLFVFFVRFVFFCFIIFVVVVEATFCLFLWEFLTNPFVELLVFYETRLRKTTLEM